MNIPVFDFHCDTALVLLGKDMNAHGSLRRNNGHIDLERAKSNGGYAQCFACFTTPFMEQWNGISPVTAFQRELAVIQAEMHKQDDLIRQAFSVKEILDHLTSITEKQVSIVVLDNPMLDTRISSALTGDKILPLIINTLDSIYDTDKLMRKSRQAKGIAAAKAEGKVWGRKRIAQSEEFEELLRQKREGTITIKTAAERLGVSVSTFQRRMKEAEGKR